MIVALLAVLFSLQAGAVADSLLFNVRGVVRDASSGKTLEAVAVTVKGTHIATITNRDGAFVIKSDVRPRQLEFSLLGYNPQTVDVTGAEMRVRLTRSSTMLDAATVIDGGALGIVRYAIEKIADNVPDEPELFDCFYRETVQKRQRYIYVSEAVTKMYKAAWGNVWGRDRASVVKSRILTSPRLSDTLGVKVQGGPVMAVHLDLVKTGAMVICNSDLPMYSFEMLAPDVIDGRPQYVIGFSPAVEEEIAQQHGKLYIDRQTFAFTRIETSLDVSDPDKATRAMLVNRPAGLRFRPKEMTLLLNYKEENGVYRLSYLKTTFRFNCDWRRRLFATDFTTIAEMVVTNRHNGFEAVPIQRSEEFSSGASLADKSRYYADPDFWKDYNIIEPSTSLEQALGRLKK
ncbi:MAG: carboxypeptidase-like regulatory domain-containing protein [Bacteroidales bacterium]|nr:carboxypeptidase-like regulatory domain-containing protein [Bacteroidales bacterium]